MALWKRPTSVTRTRLPITKSAEMIGTAADRVDQADSGEEEAESIETLMTPR